MCVKEGRERGEGRKEEKAGGRKLGGGEVRKDGRKKGEGGEIIKGERDRQGDGARLPQEAHRDGHMESYRISNMWQLGIGTLELDLSLKYLNFNFSSYKMRILTSKHCKLTGD